MINFRSQPLLTSPRVTVVIPCYKYGHFLEAAVASAFDQPGVDVDVIIVDDASPDGSAAVARAIAQRNPRVEAVIHERNMGHIATYNHGLARASGDYLTLVSADDLIAPGALGRAVALMEAHREVGFVYGYPDTFQTAPPLANDRVRNWSVWPGMKWLELSASVGRSFILSPEVVMRTAAYGQTRGYDPRLPHSADLDMWLQTAVRWSVGRVNGATQAFYRVHSENMHLTMYAGWVTDLRERRLTFEILFHEHGAQIPRVAALRSTAMHSLAKEALRRALESHRDYPGGPQTKEYLDFALETYPDIRRDLAWRLCEIGPLSHRDFPATAIRRLASHTRDSIRWRRHRRYGL